MTQKNQEENAVAVGQRLVIVKLGGTTEEVAQRISANAKKPDPSIGAHNREEEK